MLNVDFSVTLDEIEANGERLGSGCYGSVYAYGDVVYKVGSVSQEEVDNLNEANRRMGGVFPRAVMIREPGFGSEGIIALERIKGQTLIESLKDEWGDIDYSQADMILFEIRDILHYYGIRHQDLHAGNVMVTDDGMLRVIDGGMMQFYTPGGQAPWGW